MVKKAIALIYGIWCFVNAALSSCLWSMLILRPSTWETASSPSAAISTAAAASTTLFDDLKQIEQYCL